MTNAFRLLPCFLPALLATARVVAAQGEPAPAEAPFVEVFGAPEQAGSFRVGFSSQTGGIVFLQALDHFRSVEAKRNEVHESGDYLLLIDGSNHALSTRFGGESGLPTGARAPWQHTRQGDQISFTLTADNGLVFEKVYRHRPQLRGFDVTLRLSNPSANVGGSLPVTLAGPALVNGAQASLFGDVSLSIAAAVDDGDVLTVKASVEEPRQPLALTGELLQFAGSTNRFFGAFMWPQDEPARSALRRLDVQTIPPRERSDDRLTSRVLYGLSLPIPASGAAPTSVRYGLYIGPKSYREFATLPEAERTRFEPILDVDLNPPCCGGITIPGGRPMAKVLLTLLAWFHGVLGNWGFSIILLTILVRGCMFPLNFRMQKSMRAYGKKMATLKPQLDALKKQHGDDQRAYQQAMIQFQREHKIMPPIGGCLPIFLTMPIYLGLFTALRTAYDLRHQPFVGWIDDLSRSDRALELGFWPDYLNVLPLLWIGLFLFMSLRQPLPTDPQQRQMQSMMRFMPLMFGVMLYGYASALLVYMVTSMLWSLVESSIVKKILGPIDPNAAAMAPTPM